MTIYLELGDYCEIAAELLGTTPEQVARLPRIALADSALASPQAGFGDQDAYPTLVEKAAVLVEAIATGVRLSRTKKLDGLCRPWGSPPWSRINLHEHSDAARVFMSLNANTAFSGDDEAFTILIGPRPDMLDRALSGSC